MNIVKNLSVGEDYPDELKRRLARFGITHGELSRESGIAATQISRYFNKPMIPRMENIKRIELAILRIRERRRGEKGK